MVCPVIQRDADIDNRISCEDPFFDCLADTFFNRRDKFIRDCPSADLIDKLKSFTALKRFNAEEAVAELSPSSCLSDILSFCFCLAGNRFFIRNLWRADGCSYLKFPKHPVEKNFKMEFSHTRDNRLVRFMVCPDLKCRVFFSKPLERIPHFFLI